ncbi:MAG: replication initiator protein [Microvirus sp.]|nr:MAG: replication initiator protein [Microvirus sp.]
MGEGGKRLLTFNPLKAVNSTNSMTLPCGKCTGCRLDHAQEWAVRSIHESRMHKENCFITLTFDNEHLPEDYSVHVRTWQLFMKKLRKKFGSKIRFYACGEYGDLNKRPHYHALIFNHDFHDKKYYQTTPQENILYTSQTLTDLWSYGFATTGNIDYQSAGYCTRYNMKKINGGIAADHYWREHPLTKQMVSVQPEFATQSRRPGLGQKFFEQHKAEIFPADYIVIEGRKLPVPRYYLNQLTEEERTKILKRRNPVGVEVDAASGRVLLVDKTESRANKTSERLRSREAVQKARISSLKRNI